MIIIQNVNIPSMVKEEVMIFGLSSSLAPDKNLTTALLNKPSLKTLKIVVVAIKTDHKPKSMSDNKRTRKKNPPKPNNTPDIFCNTFRIPDLSQYLLLFSFSILVQIMLLNKFFYLFIIFCMVNRFTREFRK